MLPLNGSCSFERKKSVRENSSRLGCWKCRRVFEETGLLLLLLLLLLQLLLLLLLPFVFSESVGSNDADGDRLLLLLVLLVALFEFP